MANIELTLQNFLISAALLAVVWRLRKVFVKHPFDNLPGPPSPSFLYGLLFELLYSRRSSYTPSLLQAISIKFGIRKDGLSIKTSRTHTALSSSTVALQASVTLADSPGEQTAEILPVRSIS